MGKSKPHMDLDYVKSVKAKYEKSLMQKPDVVGVGIGFTPFTNARKERTLALVVNVKKMDATRADIPTELDGVPVTIKLTGAIKALPLK
jgi:hypothetical protein